MSNKVWTITYKSGREEEFTEHSEFTNYAASQKGKVINLTSGKFVGYVEKDGYIRLGLRKNGETTKIKRSHFVFECFNGLIKNQDCVKANPTGNWIIDHINNKQITNDSLDNLQLITSSENLKKSYSQGRIQGNTSGNPRKVIAINLTTNNEIEFSSMYQVGKKLNINSRAVQYVCDRRTKTATSKTDGVKYTFKYK
jgi:hypothetical protein